VDFTHVASVDGRPIKQVIWDTAGQERFYTIAKAYFRNAVGVIRVFDITDRKSFDSLPRWLRDSRVEADPNCTVMLVGNKSDFAQSRTVTPEEAEAFASSHELTYVETSALDGTESRASSTGQRRSCSGRSPPERLPQGRSSQMVLSRSNHQRPSRRGAAKRESSIRCLDSQKVGGK
jgi:small GTP-binding protein